MRRAFSLIELVVTLAILGVVAAIAVPRLTSARSGSRLAATEKRLISAFETAGETARARGSTMTMQISASRDAFFLFEGTTVSRATLVGGVDFGAAPYEADIVSTNIADPDGYVLVDAFGVYEASVKVNISVDGVSKSVTLSGPVGTIAANAAAGAWDEDEADKVLEIGLLGLKIKIGG